MEKNLAPALALLALLTACASMPDGSAPGVDAAMEAAMVDDVIAVVFKALPTIIETLTGERITP